MYVSRPHFYQTRSAWSVDQGSNKNHSPAYNFAPTVTKFCVMWEGLSLLHDTKLGNCRCKIVDSRAFPSWSLIHGLRWSGLIKAEPDVMLKRQTSDTGSQWLNIKHGLLWVPQSTNLSSMSINSRVSIVLNLIKNTRKRQKFGCLQRLWIILAIGLYVIQSAHGLFIMRRGWYRKETFFFY